MFGLKPAPSGTGVFVTGTDTGVGKTYVSCLVVEALRRAGASAVGFKPFVCGGREDAYALHEASGREADLDTMNPVHLLTPAAPLAASMIEGREIDFGRVSVAWDSLVADFDRVVVEGVGGWEVPLVERATMADFAREIGLPVLVVVDNKLGALNHTLLTVAAVRSRGLRVLGIILNSVADERDSASISNRAVLAQALPDVPVLAEILHGEDRLELDGWPAPLGGGPAEVG